MRRIVRLASLGFACLAAVQAAIAAAVFHVQELFPLPGHVEVHANAINAAGQVVGFSLSAGGFTEAVLWSGATVQNLRTSPFLNNGFAAADINDLGQIVGMGINCDPVPGNPICGPIREFNIGMGPVALPIDFSTGFSATAWVAPGSPVGVPVVPTNCAMGADGFALHVSNAGYTVGSGGGLLNGGLASPNLGALCGLNVTQLYENGVAVIPSLGFLYDPFVDFFDPINNITRSGRAWVVAPSCSGNEDAHLYPSGIPVSDDVKATICNLVASGFVRDRQQNASGQIISNVNGRALLFTPVPEPGNLALLASALTCLAFARRKKDASLDALRFDQPRIIVLRLLTRRLTG
jgi:probable HAF family extracellular repeat protein